MPTETERLIELVRLALDEFESVTLAASIRRALRIAQLKGDSAFAWHFRKDLRPIGGSRNILRAELQAFWPDADTTTLSTTDRALLEDWLAERSITNATERMKERMTDPASCWLDR
jgi:sugar/nucleoside kinase (ribokinase family)